MANEKEHNEGTMGDNEGEPERRIMRGHHGAWRVSAGALIMGLSLGLSQAWALDLSTSSDDPGITPVSQIMTDKMRDAMTVPVSMDGSVGVDTLKSLQYTPSESAIAPSSVQALQQPSASTTTGVTNNTLPKSSASSAPQASQTAVPVSGDMQMLTPFSNGISTTPLIPQVAVSRPSFLVFPVLSNRGGKRVFGDMPVLYSTTFANQLANKLHQSGNTLSVMNPVYTYDALKDKGLDGVYQQMIADYLQAGQPSEKDVSLISQQLSTTTQQPTWLVLVEAQLDMDHQQASKGVHKAFIFLYDQGGPDDPTVFVKGIVQIFGMQNGAPLLWSKETSEQVKMSELGLYNPSVFDTMDNTMNFRRILNKMALQVVGEIPATMYTSVPSIQGKVVSQSNVSPQDMETLKRLVQGSN